MFNPSRNKIRFAMNMERLMSKTLCRLSFFIGVVSVVVAILLLFTLFFWHMIDIESLKSYSTYLEHIASRSLTFLSLTWVIAGIISAIEFACTKFLQKVTERGSEEAKKMYTNEILGYINKFTK